KLRLITKMNLRIVKYLLLFSLLFSSHFAYAQDSETYFKKGTQAYVSGDLDTAIANLEQVYKISPEEKIKLTLSRLLALKGKKLLDAGSYQAAVDLLGRAVKLGYEDATKDYRTAIAELQKQQALEKQRKIAKLKAELEKLSGKKEVAPEMPLPSQEKPKILLPTPGIVPVSPKLFIISISVIVGIVVIGSVVIIAVVKRTIRKRSIDLLYQQERILKMMDSHQLLTEEDKKIVVTKGKDGFQQIVSISPQARQRAERVELIEEALKDEKNPKVAEQLLAPFLTDPNNRVRANAAKAIYRHNKKAALTTLEQMTKSDNKWMKISAAWAIGEIKSPEAAVFLAPLLTDQDQHVRQRAIKSMENIISANPPQVVANIQKKISTELEQTPEKPQEAPKPAPAAQISRLEELKEKLLQLRLGKKV
ncbi:MAG: HEAT repeat domain-containing protein, partial [Elusimicrobiota bacterium]|nr:HEAT repeat domain-containing protein [Elusimicrobiota bacterium]